MFVVVFGHKTEDCDDEEVILPLNVYLLQYQQLVSKILIILKPQSFVSNY